LNEACIGRKEEEEKKKGGRKEDKTGVQVFLL